MARHEARRCFNLVLAIEDVQQRGADFFDNADVTSEPPTTIRVGVFIRNLYRQACTILHSLTPAFHYMPGTMSSKF